MNEEKNVKCFEVYPATDILDDEKATTVVMEIPGANSKTVSVEVDHRIMTVEAKSFLTHKGDPLLYKRSFQLSDAVDVETISAKTQDGVLTLTLPKSARAQVHHIAVE